MASVVYSASPVALPIGGEGHLCIGDVDSERPSLRWEVSVTETMSCTLSSGPVALTLKRASPP
eukprot:scaffold268904_cov33-Tisochrysis_lutea.AAC.2